MRTVLLMSLFTSCWFVCAPAARADLSGDLQVSVTRVNTGDHDWRIWTRRADGHLVSVHRNSSPWTWTDRGTGGSNIGFTGVAGSWWYDGTNNQERAYFVALDGKIYEYALTNGGSATWTSLAPPAGKTFSGDLTALTGLSGGHRYTVIAALTEDNFLYSTVKDITAGTGWSGWALRDVNTWQNNLPLTATVDSTGTIWSIFGSRPDSTLAMARFTDGTGWANSSLGSPGAPVCGSIAATQAQLSASEYRVYVFCTHRTLWQTTTYLAYAASAGTTTFTWTTLANPVSVKNAAFTLATIDRPSGTGRAADAYLLGTDNHVYRWTRPGGGAFAVSDLGSTGAGETTSIVGGVVAMRDGLVNNSRTAFLGHPSTLTTAIYTREAPLGASWPWEALGDGTPVKAVTGGDKPRVEPSLAEWQGKVMTAAIVRPGTGGPSEYSYVQTAWSGTDGQSWASPVTIPTNGTQYIADPSVTFTDAGKAYVFVAGVNFIGGVCSQSNINATAIYYVTSTNGSLSSPTTVAASGGILDHPNTAIDRSRSPDRIHIVWWDYPTAVRYAFLDDGGSLSPVQTIDTATSGPPEVTVAADGSVYVSWFQSGGGSTRLCKLNPSLTACDGTPYVFTDSFAGDQSDVVAGTYYIRAGQSYNIRVSSLNSNRIYYAFHKRETDGSEKDIYFSVGTYNPTSHTFSFSTPVLGPTYGNDNFDQFNPSINVNNGGEGAEGITLSWYDRNDSAGCPGGSNYCLKRKRSESFNGGLSFLYAQASQAGALTNVAILPRSCMSGSVVRYVGDYQDGNGVALHSHHIWASAPVGSADPTALLTQGFVSASGFYY